MKVLILNGSPRAKKGNTKQMIDAFCEGLKEAGHEWDVIHVTKLNIRGCLVCEVLSRGRSRNLHPEG